MVAQQKTKKYCKTLG